MITSCPPAFSATRAPFDSSVVREWYGQLAEASKTPGLVQHLVRRTGELLPKFVTYYDRLRALPRRMRRAIARCRGLSLAGVALLLALSGSSVRAATIHVDETTCRLADAIVASNTDAATAGCPAGSGPDGIVLDSDVTLGSDLPEVTLQTTILAGSGSTIDGAGHACIHVGYPFGVVRLEGLTIRNCVRIGGGAAYNENDLTVVNCTISGNRATGGFLYGGGGIQNFYGNLVISNTIISGNTSAGDGGGVINNGGIATITDSTISGNTAGNNGGGFDNFYSAYSTITNCLISGNGAAKGGGVSSGVDWNGGSLEIRSSTVSGNTATTGGGVLMYEYGTLGIQASTISGNTASAKGGGLAFDPNCFYCYVTLVDTTVSNNGAGEEAGGVLTQGLGGALTLEHALVSGNDAPLAPEMSLGPDVSTAANDFNLVGYDGDDRSEGFSPGATDVVPGAGILLEDVLSPLADNGGPTPTHALVAGSPAIDAIPTSVPGCVGTIDQRGVTRPVGPGCDVGSFELDLGRTPFGGSVTGFAPRQVTCVDRTTGEGKRSHPGESQWDCEALGLTVEPGDTVETTSLGTADASGSPVGGAVTGMTPTAVFCENLSTGAKVKTATSATSWDCEALGLPVEPGDRVTTGAVGTIPARAPARGR